MFRFKRKKFSRLPLFSFQPLFRPKPRAVRYQIKTQTVLWRYWMENRLDFGLRFTQWWQPSSRCWQHYTFRHFFSLLNATFYRGRESPATNFFLSRSLFLNFFCAMLNKQDKIWEDTNSAYLVKFFDCYRGRDCFKATGSRVSACSLIKLFPVYY